MTVMVMMVDFLVGARQKWIHHGIHRPSPVSGDSWWQLEIVKRKKYCLSELDCLRGILVCVCQCLLYNLLQVVQLNLVMFVILNMSQLKLT